MKNAYTNAAAEDKSYDYTQGDMCGGNIPQMFCDPIIMKNINEIPLYTGAKKYNFGFINDVSEFCGFCIVVPNQHKPSEWIASIVHNSDKANHVQFCYVFFSGLKPKISKWPCHQKVKPQQLLSALRSNSICQTTLISLYTHSEFKAYLCATGKH